MYSSKINSNEKLIILTLHGEVTPGDILGWIEELSAYPGSIYKYNGIVDVRGINSAVKHEEMQAIADYTVSGKLSIGNGLYWLLKLFPQLWRSFTKIRLINSIRFIYFQLL